VGSLVILVHGALGAYISRGARQLQVFLPDDEPARSTMARAVAGRLADLARAAGLLISEVNGLATAEHPIAPFLVNAGFTPSAMGFMMRRTGASRVNSQLPTPKKTRSRPLSGMRESEDWP
jgi:ATP-dependent Lhr-like helicase